MFYWTRDLILLDLTKVKQNKFFFVEYISAEVNKFNLWKWANGKY